MEVTKQQSRYSGGHGFYPVGVEFASLRLSDAGIAEDREVDAAASHVLFRLRVRIGERARCETRRPDNQVRWETLPDPVATGFVAPIRARPVAAKAAIQSAGPSAPGHHGAYPGIKTNRMKGMSAMPTITPLAQKPRRSLRQFSVSASTIAVAANAAK